MTSTYVDANVLIAAARATDEIAERALSYLDDPQRSFVSSAFMRLEVLPKPIYLQRHDEAAFYTTFFRAVTTWAPITTMLIDQAEQLAATYGLSALDALHVASALALHADELITAEWPEKPIHRVRDLRVISIASRRPLCGA